MIGIYQSRRVNEHFGGKTILHFFLMSIFFVAFFLMHFFFGEKKQEETKKKGETLTQVDSVEWLNLR